MGGEGGMQHMINSLKNNKKLLRRKNRFENEKAVWHGKHVKSETFNKWAQVLNLILRKKQFFN